MAGARRASKRAQKQNETQFEVKEVKTKQKKIDKAARTVPVKKKSQVKKKTYSDNKTSN